MKNRMPLNFLLKSRGKRISENGSSKRQALIVIIVLFVVLFSVAFPVVFMRRSQQHVHQHVTHS